MPKLSLTMIVKDEESNLARCLDSVAPYVDEKIIVDTGSTDRTKEIAASYGATVIDCNPETHPQFFFIDDERTGAPPPYSGKPALGNFGEARNVSLDAATGDYVLWLDADDVLEGGTLLQKTVEDMQRRGISIAWMRYDYGFDDQGRTLCRLWRERLVARGASRWSNPIHEVMLPRPDMPQVKLDHMVVRHCRSAERTANVANRNFKVLKQHLAKNPDDARTLFYFGNEARMIDPDAAVVAYKKYVELSGWAEERAFARCALGEMYEQRKDLGDAFAQFSASVLEAPIPDGLFGLARIAYYKQDWPAVVRFTEEGFARGAPESVIMVNPMSRSFAPHVFYNVALNQVGRVADAYESCRRALEQVPDEPHVLHNSKLYREHLDGMSVRKPRARVSASLDIVMWTGPALETWSPASPTTTGIGGSETACIEVCKHLAALGHKVTVFSDCAGHEGAVDGVEYKHYGKFAGADCDVFISSRQPAIMDHNIRASLKLLWVHDIHVGQPNPKMHEWLLKFDRILCLTEWHRQFFLSLYQWLHPASVIVTRDGLDPARFLTGEPGARQNRLIFSSSANRGLDVLLDLFPRVRAQVPDAELHVFYGWESWETSARRTNNHAELQQIAGLKKRLAETEGVTWRGRVDQQTLAREMMQAKVWAYPTAFAETYGIGAIEAQAAGCVPITSALAALNETARFGILLPGANTDPAYQEAWVRETVACLRNEDKRAQIAAAGRQWALGLTWQSLAADWSRMFDQLIVEMNVEMVPRWEGMIGKRAA